MKAELRKKEETGGNRGELEAGWVSGSDRSAGIITMDNVSVNKP